MSEDAGEALIRSLATALIVVHDCLVANGYLDPGQVSASLRSVPYEPGKPLLGALIEGLAVDMDARPAGVPRPPTGFSVITGGRGDS